MAIEVVEFRDETDSEIVYRFPLQKDADIKWGAQLVVRESQEAIFFRDGKALDVFGPGRHTLTTQNLPLLSGLIKMPFGERTLFKAEVYFVNMKLFTDLKWGTPSPIDFRDQELDIVQLRANGVYAIRIIEPQLFVNKLVATQNVYTTEGLNSYLKKAIVTRFIDVLGENIKTIIDVSSKYDEISVAAKYRMKDDFEKLGIELADFYVIAITPTEEVRKIMRKRARMKTVLKAAGDVGSYMKYKIAEAIGGMGRAGGGGGAMGEGMGLTAGLGIEMMPAMIQAGNATCRPISTSSSEYGATSHTCCLSPV